MVTALYRRYLPDTFAEMIQKNVDAVGMPKWTEEEHQRAKDFQKKYEKPVIGLQREKRRAERSQKVE